jgi:hypothetical protein
MPLASTLSQQVAFTPGAVLGFEEVDRRLRAQQATIAALGLGVPTFVTVRVAEDDAPALAVERIWI